MSARKQQKINRGAECLKGGEEQHFFTDVRSIAVCLICSKPPYSRFSILNVTVLQNVKDIVPIYLCLQEEGKPKSWC
jgi:hypothetical protein